MVEAVILSVRNWKHKSNCLPPWSNSFFSKIAPNKRCTCEPFRQTGSFKNSFLPYPIKEWNKLDPEIRNAGTYAYFRKMLLKFIRAIGNSTYKIYDSLGIKLLTRLQLGFSHLSEHKFRHNFADSINPLCSCSLENESTHSIYSLRHQNYTTLRRALTTYLENINDANMSLNESDLLQELNISIQLVYSESVRHEYKYTDWDYQMYQRL